MTNLKLGWQRVKFGEVVRLNKETCKDPEAAGINRVIGLEHLEPGDLRGLIAVAAIRKPESGLVKAGLLAER